MRVLRLPKVGPRVNCVLTFWRILRIFAGNLELETNRQIQFHTTNIAPNTVHIITRVQKYDKSHVEIILDVRQYFEEECFQRQSFNLNRVVDRTAAATGLPERIMNEIRTEEDLENWAYESGQSIAYCHKAQVIESFTLLVRKKSVICSQKRSGNRLSS